MLSAKAKYGLKAVVRLAMESQSRPVLGADLATQERIPKKFLEQILLELKHRGLLQTKRGRNGGYLLTRSSSDITVGQIVRALDGPISPLSCVSETAYVKACDYCYNEATCGTHLVMKQVRDAMSRILDSTTLADVVRMIAVASHSDTQAVPSPASSGAKRPGPVGLAVRHTGLQGRLRR